LTRLGNPEFLYVAMAAGAAVIFAGYLQARRPEHPPAARVNASSATDPADLQSEHSGAGTARPVPPVVSLPGSRAARLEGAAPDPGAALIGAWLAAHDAETISRLCEEWSAPAQSEVVLNRPDARRAWALRLRLPDEVHPAFDRLPVPVRRQLATVADEVFLPAETGTGRQATG